jgi:hypothetical protein
MGYLDFLDLAAQGTDEADLICAKGDPFDGGNDLLSRLEGLFGPDGDGSCQWSSSSVEMC